MKQNPDCLCLLSDIHNAEGLMIYTYSDYRNYLKNIINAKQNKNASYSASCFARDLGISRSYLSLILNGKREITPKIFNSLCHKLNLNQDEQKYLSLLIEKEKSKSQEQKEFYLYKINQFGKTSNQIMKLDPKCLKTISDALRENDFGRRIEKLSKVFDISKEDVLKLILP